MDYERKAVQSNDLDCYKIGGAKQDICDTIDVYMIGKGGGMLMEEDGNHPNQTMNG